VFLSYASQDRTAARALKAALDAENPYPGLLPFEKRDAGFFFGRDRERADLVERVRRETLTVLFSRSGLGKTSLLRAGVFPLLREAGFLPIPVRLDFSERGGELRAQVQSAIASVLQEQKIEAEPPRGEETLWEYFHATHLWGAGDRLLAAVLILDQFEEVFTLGQRDPRVPPFITELADLIENYIPDSVRARIERSGEPLGFGYEKQHYRVVLSLREEYLPNLEALRGPIPSLGRNRVRLAQLGGQEALEAVARPGAALVSREIAARIVRFAAGVAADLKAPDSELAGLEIDPAILGLACRELNERRRARKLPVITTELLAGERERILPDFYQRSLRDVPTAVRRLIEDRLLTGSGYRRAEALDDVLRVPGVTEEALSRLVDRRLLRREERLGIACIELTHDVLTRVVRESRDARRAAELRRRRRRKFLIAGTASAVLAVVCIALAAVFAQLYFRAEEQQALAERHRAEAEELINFMLFDLRDRLEPLGRLDIMEAAAQKVLDYFEWAPGSEVPEAARNCSVALDNIGNVWLVQGKRQAALAAYEKSLAIRKRLAAQDPGNAGWQRDVAVSHERIGGIKAAEGDGETARGAYEKAREIYERLAAQDPGNVGFSQALARLSAAEGRSAEAMEATRKAIDILEKRFRADRLEPAWRDYLSDLYGGARLVCLVRTRTRCGHHGGEPRDRAGPGTGLDQDQPGPWAPVDRRVRPGQGHLPGEPGRPGRRWP
jgi:tetratricopeptide (TPR) repeat protein